MLVADDAVLFSSTEKPPGARILMEGKQKCMRIFSNIE